MGWAGLDHFFRHHACSNEPLSISVETAHPAKFPDELHALLGIDPAVPPSLAGIEEKEEHYENLTVAYEPFRDMLLARYA